MRYDYFCRKCSHGEELFTFEISHGMHEKPAITCPQCSGTETEKAYLSVPQTWNRGYGFNDKEGRHRDMNLWHLRNKDPYKSMRQPGEKSDLEHKLRTGGRFNPKKKHYAVSTKTKKK